MQIITRYQHIAIIHLGLSAMGISDQLAVEPCYCRLKVYEDTLASVTSYQGLRGSVELLMECSTPVRFNSPSKSLARWSSCTLCSHLEKRLLTVLWVY